MIRKFHIGGVRDLDQINEAARELNELGFYQAGNIAERDVIYYSS